MRARIPWIALVVAIVLVGGLALVAAGCGGTSSTSSTVSITTSSTEAATSTSGAATTAGSATTVAGGPTTVPGPTGAGPIQLKVQLTGADEVPAVQTSATGTLTLTVDISGADYKVSYELDVQNITDATAAHIHMGAKGQNGDVIYPLFTGPVKTGTFSGTLAEGTFDPSQLAGTMQGKGITDLATAVLGGNTYVNVHTKANPNGEIRGQIVLSLPSGEVTAGQEVTTTT